MQTLLYATDSYAQGRTRVVCDARSRYSFLARVLACFLLLLFFVEWRDDVVVRRQPIFELTQYFYAQFFQLDQFQISCIYDKQLYNWRALHDEHNENSRKESCFKKYIFHAHNLNDRPLLCFLSFDCATFQLLKSRFGVGRLLVGLVNRSYINILLALYLYSAPMRFIKDILILKQE